MSTNSSSFFDTRLRAFIYKHLICSRPVNFNSARLLTRLSKGKGKGESLLEQRLASVDDHLKDHVEHLSR